MSDSESHQRDEERTTINVTVHLALQCCPHCGCAFGYERGLKECRAADGKPIYCPNGHKLYFGGSPNDRPRKSKPKLRKKSKPAIADKATFPRIAA